MFISLGIEEVEPGIKSWTTLPDDHDWKRHAKNNLIELKQAWELIAEAGSEPAAELVRAMRVQFYSENRYPFVMAMTHVMQFAGMKTNDGSYRGLVMVPFNWYVMYDRNPFFECGELVTMACRCRDFTIDPVATMEQIGDNESVVWRRGKMYEADFLLKAQPKFPEYPMSPSQRKLTELYPRGVDSDPTLRYPTPQNVQ